MTSTHSSRREKQRKSKGTVQTKVSNGRLQLVFSWQGQRYYLSVGLPDTPLNRKGADRIARQIELDFVSGNFDPSLDKYRPQSVLRVQEPDITPKATPKLKTVFEQYMEYRSPHVSPKTINGTYEPVLAHMARCKTDGLQDPLKFRMELLQATTESQARRTLMQLSAACKWALKHSIVDTNPFEGMYKDLAPSKPPPPVAFTVEERDLIIEAFETDTRPGMNYRYYTPFIKFLFWTGCRPCEAIGLRWGRVSPDCSHVHFCESIVEVSGRLERRFEDKTAVKRWFSCPVRLQKLLQSIKPEQVEPDDLVFPSPKGKAMVESNFSDRAWAKILTKLGLATKDGIKMTPYNCRDTFITLQAMQGNSSTTIVRWVGNSSKVIEERYLDRMKLDHLRPTDI
jgi:integrase